MSLLLIWQRAATAFTADAVILSNLTGSFTANAVLKRTDQASSFTADATPLRTQSGSFTAQAVIKATQTGSTTADAVRIASRTGSFTADAILGEATVLVTGSFTADSVLKATISGSFTAFAVVLMAGTTGSFTADAVLKTTGSSSFTANASLKRTISGSTPADAVKRQTQDWRSMIARAAPRLWYRCDDASGGLIDYGAEARNATTITGTPVYRAAGRIDGAVSLSGSQSFATASFALALTTSIITIEAWVWPGTASYTGSTRQTIYSGNDTAGAPELELGANAGTNRIAAIINGTFVAVTADNAFVPQTWNHIVYRRSGNGAGTHTFHVNGVSQSLGTDAANNYTSTTAVKRVGSRTSSTQFFNGLIDEVVVYDRVISTAEIAAHYAILGQIPTADAVKLKPGQSGSFTAQAGDLIAGTRTFASLTADAAKFRATTSTRTINAIKRQTISSSITADAVIRSRGFNADANIKATITASLLVDAHFAIGGSFTADALRKRTQTGSFTINAIRLARIFRDDFNRTTTPGQYLGGTWSWTPRDSITEDVTQVRAYTDGSSVVLPDQGIPWWDSYTGFPVPAAGEARFDFLAPALSDGTVPAYGIQLDANGTTKGVYVSASSTTDMTLGQAVPGSYTFTPTPGEWYSVRGHWSGSIFQAKVWLRSGSEPSGWQVDEAQTFTALGNFQFTPYLDFYYFPVGEDGAVDNVEIWSSVSSWTAYGGFQAQARLVPRFTVDAVIAISPSRTVVVRAMKRQNALTSSLTADATFTVDTRGFGSLTANANVYGPGSGSGSLTADANLVAVTQRDPGRGQGTGGGNAGGGASGGMGNNLDVFIRYDGVDITDNVKFDQTKFISSVSGRPGEFEMVVVDRDHIYDFEANKTVTLDVAGKREWAGWAAVVTAGYGFAVDNTEEPDETVRWWTLSGPDVNMLFIKRVVYDKANPANGNLHKFDVDTSDGDIIRYVVNHYTDLEADGVTLSLSDVGTPIPDKRGPGGAVPGRTFGEFMYFVSQLSGGIGYIDPTYVLHYEDDDTEDAPFRLSDRPAGRSNYAGVADFRLQASGSDLINDAQIWGAGQASPVLTYDRIEDSASIAAHGRWQEGELRGDLYKQASVNRVARSYVYGSPQNLRGHKDDRPVYHMRLFRNGLVAGMKVQVESEVFGVSEIIPIRMMTITFPTPYNPMYELECAHELDAIWSISEWPPFPKIPLDDGWGDGGGVPGGGVWHPPVIHQGDCSDADCGITDDFDRVAASGWGTSTAGIVYTSFGTGVDAGVNGTEGFLSSDAYELWDGQSIVIAELATGQDFAFTVTFHANHQLTGTTIDGLLGAEDGEYVSIQSQGNDPWIEMGCIESVPYLLVHSNAHRASLPGLDFTSPVTIRASYTISDSTLRVKSWQASDQEPTDWMVSSSEATGFDILSFVASKRIGLADGPGPRLVAYFDNLDISGVNRCSAIQFDDFNRDVNDGWGITNAGVPWTTIAQSSSVTNQVNGSNVVFATSTIFTSSQIDWNSDELVSAPWWLWDDTFTVGTLRSSTMRMRFASASLGVDVTFGPGHTYWLCRMDNSVGGYGYNYTVETAKTDWIANAWYIAEWTYDATTHTQSFTVYEDGTTPPTPLIHVVDPGDSALRLDIGSIQSSFRTAYIDWIEGDYDGKPCFPCGSAVDTFDRTVTSAVTPTSTTGTLGTGPLGTWVRVDDDFPPSTAWCQVGVDGTAGLIEYGGGTSPAPGRFASHRLFRSLSLPTEILAEIACDGLTFAHIARIYLVDGSGAFDPVNGLSVSLFNGPISLSYDFSSGTLGGGVGFASTATYPSFVAGEFLSIRLRAELTVINAKVWRRADPEPADWTLTVPVASSDQPILEALMPDLSILYDQFANTGGASHIDRFEIVSDCTAATPATTTSEIPPGPGSYGCEIATRLSSTIYTVTYQIVGGSSQVAVNGLNYFSGIDYNTVGDTIYFINALPTDAVVYACYRGLG